MAPFAGESSHNAPVLEALSPRLAARLGRGARPLRIAYGRIFHEANAYSPVATVQTAHAIEERCAVPGLLQSGVFQCHGKHCPSTPRIP